MAMISTLVTRGMTATKQLPGMDGGGRRRIGSWSKNAFRTAVAINVVYTVASALLSSIMLSPFPLGSARIKLVAIMSLMSTSFFTAGYECFEKKSENGWRWKRSMDGIIANDEVVFANSRDITELKDKYDFNYDVS